MPEAGQTGAENNGAGGQEFTWRAQLPDDYREKFPEFKDGKDGLAALTKSYGELFSLLGDKNNLLKLPNEKSTDDDRKAFSEKVNGYLGVPKEAKGYEVKLPDGAEKIVNAELLESMKATALEAGIPAKAFDKLVGKYVEGQMAALEKFTKENPPVDHTKDAEDRLRVEWKDDYQKNAEQARAMFIKMFGDKDGPALEAELQKNPVYGFSKVFHRLAAMNAEGGMSLTDSGRAEKKELASAKTMEALKFEDELRVMDPGNPKYPVLRQKIDQAWDDVKSLSAAA